MQHPGLEAECLGCQLTNGRQNLPGGRILATGHWVIEHCVGPLPVGTLIVKPLRHCVHIYDLTDAEAFELGLLLKRTTKVIQDLTESDQVYCCLWSHAGWRPGHIHFVLQPAWNSDRSRYAGPGPKTQIAMFNEGKVPDKTEVEQFCSKARELFARSA